MYLHLTATSASLPAIGTTLESTAGTTRKELQGIVCIDGEAEERPPSCQFALIFPNELSSLLVQSFSVPGPQTLLVRRLFHH